LKTINKVTPCSFVHTHSLIYLTQEEGASLRQGEDTTLQQLGFLVILGGGFSCALSLGRGALVLYGVVAAAIGALPLLVR
jgi:hypothetical protein